jgi:hypothetical protein
MAYRPVQDRDGDETTEYLVFDSDIPLEEDDVLDFAKV